MASEKAMAKWRKECQLARDRYKVHYEAWKRAVKRDDANRMQKHWDASEKAWEEYERIRDNPPR